MVAILLVTCVALVAWGMEPKSCMADWVSGVAALAGLVLLAIWHGQRYGVARRGLR
jgi:hypothetical protein